MASDLPFTVIRTVVDSEWTLTSVSWPNEPFTRPSGLEPWISIEFPVSNWAPIEIGGATWNECGVLWAHVYVRDGSGTLEGRILARRFLGLFRGRAEGGVSFGAATIGHEGRAEHDPYWVISASVTWNSQEHP
ncbi:MAG: DUF4128 domain-containing protein [Rhodospirillales bacterium]|nr:DUF4128 domain-containing protein [Rhodospirillales bacterium]